MRVAFSNLLDVAKIGKLCQFSRFFPFVVPPGSQFRNILPDMKQKKNGNAKKKRRLGAVVAAAVILAILPLVISAYVCLSTFDRIVPMAQVADWNADCVVVLGALVHDNGELSGILEDRMLTGIDAYQNGISDRMLLSGDHGSKEYDEVSAMKNYALTQGVPSHAVFLDHAGFSTYESLYRARDVFGAKRVLIVTQRYHLYRALYIARQLGLDAYGVASNLRTYGGQTRFEIREIAARDKDFFQTMWMPKPTYLGEPFSLAGDGNVTNG